MGGLQPIHWVIIAVVAAFLFFGWKQLPDMARSFGRSLRVFKTEIKGMTGDDKAREENAREADAAAPVQRAIEPNLTKPAQQPVQPARTAPQAQVVPNSAAAGSRPRPTPSPNGRGSH